ncbi:hypothetical protein [Paucisalibacillus globulus]|uniref:hypothetical protein n=1 Tax=Paucisalibacillus globulus TaxID=351095 RepID=UPI000412979F|nr:hypothetical protein [Paucisalibacillus globulus]
MNREEMKEIMLNTFYESSYQHYIEKGWLVPGDFDSFKNSVYRMHKDSARSFSYNNKLLSVDFAAGSGCKVGCPTDEKQITVYFESDGKYAFEKFTFADFVKSMWKRLNGKEEQLSLF